MPSRPNAAAALTVTVATASLGLALWSARLTSIWLTTGLAALLCLGLALGLHGPQLRRLLAWNPSRVAWGLASGLALVALTHALYGWAVTAWPALRGPTEALYALLRQWPGPMAALPLLVLVVAAEEAVWRGVLFDLLARRVSPAWAVVGCSAAYIVPQLLAGSPLLVAVAAGCGLVWTSQRAMSGELLVPGLTHLTWNVVIFTVWPLSLAVP